MYLSSCCQNVHATRHKQYGSIHNIRGCGVLVMHNHTACSATRHVHTLYRSPFYNRYVFIVWNRSSTAVHSWWARPPPKGARPPRGPRPHRLRPPAAVGGHASPPKGAHPPGLPTIATRPLDTSSGATVTATRPLDTSSGVTRPPCTARHAWSCTPSQPLQAHPPTRDSRTHAHTSREESIGKDLTGGTWTC